MKLSKKIMLFEEFNEISTKVDVETEVASTTRRVEVDRTIRTEIAQDVDTIISKLEDLARGISKQEQTNESNSVNEGTVETIMSAELYMIPVIAAGLIGGGAVAVGVLIKRAITKSKIRSQHKKSVKDNKIQATKMELYVKELRDYKKQDFDDRAKQKVEEFKKKIEELKQAAEEMNSALIEKYPNYTDFIGTLNSEVRMETAQMMLDSKALTDSEKERYQKTYRNAVSALDRRLKKAEEEKKAAEEKVKNASKEDLAKIDAEKEKLNKELEDKNREEKNSKDGQIQRVEDLIKKEEENSKEGEESDKLKKLKALKDKILAKESWNQFDFEVMILENQLSIFELELV